MTEPEAAAIGRQAEPSVVGADGADDLDLAVGLGPTRSIGKPKWVRMTIMALGVPLLLAALMVVFYLAGVIRDARRADYCSVYAATSAPLVPLYGELADVLATGDPALVLTQVGAMRGYIDQLDAVPSTVEIDAKLASMTLFLQETERAARAHDGEAIAAQLDQLGRFSSYRQAFLALSAEYCRYR